MQFPLKDIANSYNYIANSYNYSYSQRYRFRCVHDILCRLEKNNKFTYLNGLGARQTNVRRLRVGVGTTIETFQ